MRLLWRESVTCSGAIGFVEVWKPLPGLFSSASGCASPPNVVNLAPGIRGGQGYGEDRSGGNRRSSDSVSVYMAVMAPELKRFRKEKDQVFAKDPHSPLTPEQRRAFRGLAYFDENPQLVIHASIDRGVDPEEVRMGTSSGEEQVYHRYGLVRFDVDDQPAELVLYSSDDSDELFIPFR